MQRRNRGFEGFGNRILTVSWNVCGKKGWIKEESEREREREIYISGNTGYVGLWKPSEGGK